MQTKKWCWNTSISLKILCWFNSLIVNNNIRSFMLEIKMSDFTSVALISNMTLLLFLLQPLSIINTKLTQYVNAKYIALSKLHA